MQNSLQIYHCKLNISKTEVSSLAEDNCNDIRKFKNNRTNEDDTFSNFLGRYVDFFLVRL